MRKQAILWAVLFHAGCGATPGLEEDGPPAVGQRAAALVTWRNDVTAEIIPPGGPWGDWSQALYCNPGTYAASMQQRVEAPISGDDSGLNSVALYCRTRGGAWTERVSSHEGFWGTWSNWVSCGGTNYLNAARLRVEPPQGGGDDTAANDAQFSCEGSGALPTPGNGTPWGTWNNWTSCPWGSAVCGISLLMEPQQHGGDDTAMNGMKLYCCAK